MIAYKFLAKGALEPLSGFAWPEPSGGRPGAWVRAPEAPFELGQSELHVCRAEDLAHWLHEELWVAETDGDPRDGIDRISVERARLVRRIDAWHLKDALRFALACAAHATTLVARVPASDAAVMRDYIEDALASGRAGYIGVSGHAAALAATLASIELGIESSEENAYRAERVRQSEWIAQHVILPHAV